MYEKYVFGSFLFIDINKKGCERLENVDIKTFEYGTKGCYNGR